MYVYACIYFIFVIMRKDKFHVFRWSMYLSGYIVMYHVPDYTYNISFRPKIEFSNRQSFKYFHFAISGTWLRVGLKS